jgi:hypothetical protein
VIIDRWLPGTTRIRERQGAQYRSPVCGARCSAVSQAVEASPLEILPPHSTPACSGARSAAASRPGGTDAIYTYVVVVYTDDVLRIDDAGLW